MIDGTLALVGSGEYLPGMEPVDRLLLGRLNGEPRVVCLPTAAGRESADRIDYWSRLGVEHFTRLGVRAQAVRVVDRASAEDDTLAAQIRAANFVYLSGGHPGYLYKTLAGSKAWAAIQRVLDEGGVVAGCSAGAMIFGERLPSFPTIVPLRRAFNYLPGSVIMPHYDELNEVFRQVIKLLVRRRTLLGIEGNTALVLRGVEASVAGTGGVVVWNGRHRARYTHSQTVVFP